MTKIPLYNQQVSSADSDFVKYYILLTNNQSGAVLALSLFSDPHFLWMASLGFTTDQNRIDTSAAAGVRRSCWDLTLTLTPIKIRRTPYIPIVRYQNPKTKIRNYWTKMINPRNRASQHQTKKAKSLYRFNKSKGNKTKTHPKPEPLWSTNTIPTNLLTEHRLIITKLSKRLEKNRASINRSTIVHHRNQNETAFQLEIKEIIF